MKRIFAFLLLLTMLIPLFAACSGGGQGGVATTPGTEKSAETTSGTTGSAETTGAPDQDRVSLTGYSVVVSPCAADWEKSAADAVAGLVSGAVMTTQTAEKDEEILIGWTEREACLAVDYDSLETDGYALIFAGKKLLLAANSAVGMNAAVAYFEEKLRDGSIAADASVCVTKKEESEMLKSPDGAWGYSVAYANRIKNAISAGFTDQLRTGFSLSNRTMRLQFRLRGQKTQPLVLANASGVPYYENTGDVYIRDTDGNVIWASGSPTAARMNGYRMGYYYRDIHFLDQTFSDVRVKDTAEKAFNPIRNKVPSANMISTPQKGEEGVWSYTVENPADPYISFPVAYAASRYNALKVVLRCEYSTGAELFFQAGGRGGYNGEQRVPFQIAPGEDFGTYYIYLGDQVDFAGSVRGLRFDIGSARGEKVEIKSVEAVNLEKVGVNAALDRIYHTYSDKLHEELHFVITEDEDRLAEYGTEIRLAANRVKGMRLTDQNGTHDGLDGVDMDSVEALAFDINRAGVIGWIRSVDSDSARFSVQLDGDFYVIRLYRTAEKDSYEKGDSMRMGWRLYTSDRHDFNAFLNEAYIERYPLTDLRVTDTADGAAYLGYDANRGCYTFTVNGTDFNIYYKDKQRNFRISTELEGDGRTRKLYILGRTDAGCLENAVLLSGDQHLLALPVEVCKNFKGENEEPIFDPGDPSYGEAIFPMVLQANEKRSFTLIHLYTNWGIFPIKQLSSIQFIAPYYHLSCGTTESNCIAPFYVFGKDYWTLPDFRSMSAPFWSGQPQHTSIGRLYFLTYTDADGHFYGTESQYDCIDSSGPVYADIGMDYVSDDGKIKATYRHMEFPQYDENRTYYEVRLEVLEDLHIKDFVNHFSFFSFDGRDVAFSKIGYLDENNRETVRELSGKVYTDYLRLGKDAPYFDYYAGNKADYVNFAMLIKSAKLVIGGKECNAQFTVKHSFDGDLNHCYLTLDLGDVTLRAGDTLAIDLILLPWGSQHAADDTSVRQVRQDSCIAPVVVEADTGTVVADSYLPKIRAEENIAVFTLSDGRGTTAVRVYGFSAASDVCTPVLYEWIGGKWEKYDTTYHGYDGYMIYYDEDGTYSFAFCADMAQGAKRTFKVEIQK